VASPFSAEYWHIGATMIRLGSDRSRNWNGENRTLMHDFRFEEGLDGEHFRSRGGDYQLPALRTAHRPMPGDRETTTAA
jgi:hypothetical protein